MLKVYPLRSSGNNYSTVSVFFNFYFKVKGLFWEDDVFQKTFSPLVIFPLFSPVLI